MQLSIQMEFRKNIKEYNYLKENSYFFKELNRGTINFAKFNEAMKEKYKERISDKINSVVDNIDLISSVLNVLK